MEVNTIDIHLGSAGIYGSNVGISISLIDIPKAIPATTETFSKYFILDTPYLLAG